MAYKASKKREILGLMSLVATLAVVADLNKRYPDKPATVAQIAQTREIGTRTAQRHLNLLEEQGYIRREVLINQQGRPTKIHILKDIPDEVLAKIPYEDMHQPTTKAGRFFWKIMDDIVYYGKPLENLFDWLHAIGFKSRSSD